MQIEQLEEIIDLSETLSFTQTAERMHLSQPALSKRVMKLERDLGFSIFNRDQNGVRLTKQGSAFVRSAHKVVQAYHVMLQEVRRFDKGKTEGVSIGFIWTPGSQLLEEARKLFSRSHPFVDIEMVNYEFDLVNKALIEERIDAAITGRPEDLSANIYEIAELVTDPFYLFCSAEHPLAKLEFITPEDLKHETVMNVSRTYWPRHNEAIRSYLKPEVNDIEIIDMVNDINTPTMLIRTDGYLTIAPRVLCLYYEERAPERFAYVPLEGFEEQAHISFAWRRADAKRELLEDLSIDLGHAAKVLFPGENSG